MTTERGFYKTTDGLLYYAPNNVYSPTVTLLIADADTYTYPQDGWYLFDTENEAILALGGTPVDEPPQSVPPTYTTNTPYNIGDIVISTYGIAFVSRTDNNTAPLSSAQNWRFRAWDTNFPYKPSDIVDYLGYVYSALVNNSAKNPSTNPSIWRKLV